MILSMENRMKTYHLPLVIAAVAGLSLTACATRPPQQPVWNATPTASVPQEQATAKCEYDLMRTPGVFTELSLYAGQPRLSDYGLSLFQKCMQAQGYQFGGMVPYTGGAS